ncbi:MAG: FHIPEP family type III secretion protein, partial [Armatimonadetes bacterium]|nr:FHIPEP family type III secretion protein [Armatimonadota bacterium]
MAEDYLKDNYKLRKLRLILHNLLLEKVSLRDLITILEVVGDHFEEIEKIDLIAEYVRMTLAKQICWNYLDQELLLKAINLNLNLEKKLLQSIEELPKPALRISQEEAQNLV